MHSLPFRDFSSKWHWVWHHIRHGQSTRMHLRTQFQVHVNSIADPTQINYKYNWIDSTYVSHRTVKSETKTYQKWLHSSSTIDRYIYYLVVSILLLPTYGRTINKNGRKRNEKNDVCAVVCKWVIGVCRCIYRLANNFVVFFFSCNDTLST